MLAACCAADAKAGEAVCIGAAEQERIGKSYAELFTQYDLATVTQAFLVANSEVQELKEKLDNCLHSSTEIDKQHCDVLQKSYDAKMSERHHVIERFEVAPDMQEYLLTLKLKLERPRCEQ